MAHAHPPHPHPHPHIHTPQSTEGRLLLKVTLLTAAWCLTKDGYREALSRANTGPEADHPSVVTGGPQSWALHLTETLKPLNHVLLLSGHASFSFSCWASYQRGVGPRSPLGSVPGPPHTYMHASGALRGAESANGQRTWPALAGEGAGPCGSGTLRQSCSGDYGFFY